MKYPNFVPFSSSLELELVKSEEVKLNVSAHVLQENQTSVYTLEPTGFGGTAARGASTSKCRFHF